MFKLSDLLLAGFPNEAVEDLAKSKGLEAYALARKEIVQNEKILDGVSLMKRNPEYDQNYLKEIGVDAENRIELLQKIKYRPRKWRPSKTEIANFRKNSELSLGDIDLDI